MALVTYRPTSRTLLGCTLVNPGYAYDSDTATYAVCTPTTSSGYCDLKGFGTGLVKDPYLVVRTSAPLTGSPSAVSILSYNNYGVDSGDITLGVFVGSTAYTLQLTGTYDLFKLSIRISPAYDDGADYATIQIYDVQCIATPIRSTKKSAAMCG